MFWVGGSVGILIGYLLAGLMVSGSKEDDWEEGFNDGVMYRNPNGNIIARHDAIDEIMVESSTIPVARYKRVVD